MSGVNMQIVSCFPAQKILPAPAILNRKAVSRRARPFLPHQSLCRREKLWSITFEPWTDYYWIEI